jgi:hypothetical protein
MEENPRGYEEIGPTDLLTESWSDPFAHAFALFL